LVPPLQELQEQKDEVRQLELEARRPNQEDSPLTRNIRMLENRLDKAMIKYNEAQSIRKTYEQIVKRLREERIGFDSQLGALERTMQAKTRDYEELLLLSGMLVK
jgi:chromosome segregation ATPase